MTKREREALGEYVDAVAGFALSQIQLYGTSDSDDVVVSSAGETLTLELFKGGAGDRLNAADGRLRALGMLP